MIYFEWDEEKAAKNLRDHGISFKTARLALLDPFRIIDEDLDDEGEQRLRGIGMADHTAVLLVIHLEETWGEDTHVRIISARKATPVERSDYEQNRTNVRK
jgi:uncharacterized protein